MIEFEGFEPANTTPVPDILFDELLPELTEAELKILLYIIRRTWGFKKVTDAISLNQFQHGIVTREGKVLDKGCGIKNRTTLTKGLASLEKRGCIQPEKGRDAKGDNATTLYSIRFKDNGVVRKTYQGSTQNVPPVVTEAYYRSTQSGLPVVRKTYPQETVLQETVLQETVLQETVERTSEEESVASATSAHAFEHSCSENCPECARALSVTDTSHQGDNDASSVALPAVACGAQSGDSAPGALDRLQAGGGVRRDTLPEATPLPTQPTSTAKVEGALVQTPIPVTSPSDGAVGSAPPSGSRPRASGRRGKAQQQDVTQALSLQGAQVKEWMEEIKGRKRRMTEKNIQAWNALAEEDDISLDNLRDVIAEWEKSQWAKDHPDYVFDEHVLTRDGGGFTFAKGIEIVKRKRKTQQAAESAKSKTQEAPSQPLPVLRVLPPDRSKSPRLRTATQVGRA